MSPPKSQEDRNADTLEALRLYVLQRMDSVQNVLIQTVLKDDLKKELEFIYGQLSSIRSDLSSRVGDVKGDVSAVVNRMSSLEENLTTKIDTISRKQDELSKRDLVRWIAIQGAAIILIVGFTLGLAQFIIHK